MITTIILTIALWVAMVFAIVLAVIVGKLNRATREYKTAACLTMGKLGRLYRKHEHKGTALQQDLWDIWRATEVYVPDDDLDVITNCFYKGEVL